MIEKLNEKRTKAIADARAIVDSDEYNEEAYQAAVADMHRYSSLIKDEEARQLAEANTVAVERAAEISHQTTHVGEVDVVAEQRQMIQEFVTPGSERKQLGIPVPEARTTGVIVTDDGGAGAYGSYTVPETWWKEVYFHVNAESGVLASNCTVLNTASGEQIDIPKLNTDAAAVLTAQGSAATETIPVFTQPVLNAYRLDGFFSVSKEFLDDTAINAEGFLRTAAARAIATAAATYAATGTGSSQPAGLNYTTEPTTAGKTAAAQTTFTSDEIMDLYLSVAKSSRMRGEFVAGTTAYGIMLKWKDDEGRYLVTNPTVSEGPTFMGKAIREDADYQATTTGLCPVTFGDMSAFWVRWARGMDFTRDDSFAFSSFQSTFRFAAWFDCVLVDTLAVKHLLMA
jgi:HK97 family phage major capsid protein